MIDIPQKSIREAWRDFWTEKSKHLEQTYLTPDTNSVILDFVTTLLQTIESEIEGENGYDFTTEHETNWIHGYNQALDSAKTIISKYKQN